MKNQATVIIVALATAAMAMWPSGLANEDDIIVTSMTEEITALEEIPVPEKLPKPVIAKGLEEWISSMISCESSGDPNAINQVDRDGTPSYGLLQFKPSTFEMYKKRYGIEGELMDPKAQLAILRRMVTDPKVRWLNEFPDCIRKHGYPPGRPL